jgi:hypothetical protein
MYGFARVFWAVLGLLFGVMRVWACAEVAWGGWCCGLVVLTLDDCQTLYDDGAGVCPRLTVRFIDMRVLQQCCPGLLCTILWSCSAALQYVSVGCRHMCWMQWFGNTLCSDSDTACVTLTMMLACGPLGWTFTLLFGAVCGVGQRSCLQVP